MFKIFTLSLVQIPNALKKKVHDIDLINFAFQLGYILTQIYFFVQIQSRNFLMSAPIHVNSLIHPNFRIIYHLIINTRT